MSDHIQLNLGTGGDVLAAKDISSVKYQRFLGTEQSSGDVTLDGVNDELLVDVDGTSGIGGYIEAGTLAGTIVAETYSGSTWGATYLRVNFGPLVTSHAFTNPNARVHVMLFVAPGDTRARIRVSAYTSGSAIGRLKSGTRDILSLLHQAIQTAGVTSALVPSVLMMGGMDASGSGGIRTPGLSNENPPPDNDYYFGVRVSGRSEDVDINGHTNYKKFYYTNTGAVTDGIVWSPAAGKRWHVVSMKVHVSAAATVTLEDDVAAGDVVLDKGEYAAGSGFAQYYGEKYPLASQEDAADLLVTTTGGNIYISGTGYEV